MFDFLKFGNSDSFHQTFTADDETPIGGEFKTSIETGESRYFSENEIPEENQLSLSRILPSQIKRLFEHYRNPALPTDFD